MRGRLATVVALLTTGAAAGWSDDGLRRLERLGSAIREHSAWTSSYHQEYLPAGMDLGEETEGMVWIAWPDRALFDTGSPPVRRLGLDGRKVRLLDLEVPSCDDHTLSDEEWSRVPLAAVLDPRAAVEQFTVLAAGDDGVVLVPRDAGGISRVIVRAGPGGLPREVVVEDPQGATNRLVFDDWRPVAGPSGGAWLPAPPSDLECVQDAGAASSPG